MHTIKELLIDILSIALLPLLLLGLAYVSFRLWLMERKEANNTGGEADEY